MKEQTLGHHQYSLRRLLKLATNTRSHVVFQYVKRFLNASCNEKPIFAEDPGSLHRSAVLRSRRGNFNIGQLIRSKDIMDMEMDGMVKRGMQFKIILCWPARVIPYRV